MRIKFTKMHGLGNDFVMIDAVSQRLNLTVDMVKHLANRRYGVGCDQVLLVETPSSPDVDFRYRIFNADGSEVQNCGNGARCFAAFVREQRLTGKTSIAVETSNGKMQLDVEKGAQIRVNMGLPRLTPDELPFVADQERVAYPLQFFANDTEQQTDIGAVSMGNPHAVLLVEDVDTAPVENWGPVIEHHPRFPERVNVGFMEVINRGHIRLRVHERGAGETEACGTGACAAMVAGRRQGLLDRRVKVSLPGGDLTIEWLGLSHPVYMIGPATTVFQGSIYL